MHLRRLFTTFPSITRQTGTETWKARSNSKNTANGRESSAWKCRSISRHKLSIFDKFLINFASIVPMLDILFPFPRTLLVISFLYFNVFREFVKNSYWEVTMVVNIVFSKVLSKKEVNYLRVPKREVSRSYKSSPTLKLMPVFPLQMVTRTKKIFVGGLSAPTTLEDVKNYFEQFGPVSTKYLKFIYYLRCSARCKVNLVKFVIS